MDCADLVWVIVNSVERFRSLTCRFVGGCLLWCAVVACSGLWCFAVIYSVSICAVVGGLWLWMLFIVVVVATARVIAFVAYVVVVGWLFACFVMVVNSVVISISWLHMLRWFLG